MLQGRALRHASLLLLFGLLLVIGVFFENALDSDDGAYADDVREQRDGGAPLRALLHSPAYWRGLPLTLDRTEYPYVTDAFAQEFLARTSPPQLTNVVDNRTLMSADFFEELQLWRKPGSAAARMLHVLRAEVERERVAARAEAVRRRRYKSWKTRAPPAPSALSFLLPSFLTRGDGKDGSLQTEEDNLNGNGGGGGGSRVVAVRYTEDVLYYGMGSTAAAAAAAPAVDGATAQRHRAVSLGTDEVRLVPYPLVPFSSLKAEEGNTTTPLIEPRAGVRQDKQEGGEKTGTHTETPPPPQQQQQQRDETSTLVRIHKGKLRYTVPHRTTPHTPTHGWDHFYIALNLWKNEDVIPDLTEALIVFLEEEVKPYFDLATAVVVSIYANVSPDRTAELIESILIPRLHAIHVRAVYATTEGSCLGYVERHPFHERIEWMACIRNKALEPLYERGMGVFHPPREANTAREGTKVKHDAERQPQEKEKKEGDGAPSRNSSSSSNGDGLVVLFFNDIFFRPQDITTLLESRAETTIRETVRPHGWLTSVPPSQLVTSAATADARGEADAGVAGTPTSSQPAPEHETKAAQAAQTPGTTFDMACGMDFYYTFYDTWVTRDRLGSPFEAQMPYSDDHATQEAFYRIFSHDLGRQGRWRTSDLVAGASPESASVPVKCCWNGVAALRGRFFLPPTPEHRKLFPTRRSTADLLAPARRFTQKDEEEKITQLDGDVGNHDLNEKSRLGNASPPLVLQRPSGAIYDLIGTVRDAVNATGLAAYYARVLTRRLQSERLAWNSTRSEIAELTGHPFYKPIVYDNTSSFPALLRAVMAEEEQKQQLTKEGKGDGLAPAAARFEWLTPVLALNKTQAELEKQGAGGVEQPREELRVREDSTYYVARHPAVRFRHAFTPSYGATVRGLKPVRDDVCLSSECLLICQDVMQAAILQDRRVPVILLNPHVRVAYDLAHFERITRHTWFFEHPYVYWIWVMARRVQLWWLTGNTTGRGAGDGDTTAATKGAAGIGVLQAAEVRELGQATSATDDWLRDAAAASLAPATPNTPERLHESTRRILSIEDGLGNVIDVGVTDIATLTRMTCQRITAGSIDLAVGAFFPLLRFGQLLVVALLLRWMCWSIQADVATEIAKHGSHNSDGGAPISAAARQQLAIEEQWWCALYNALWYSAVARRVRGWVNGLSRPSDGNGTTTSTPTSTDAERELFSCVGETCHRTADMGDSGAAFFIHRNTDARRSSGASTTSLPPVPVLHLQLRQHYRRRKVAATLGTCAHQTRRCARMMARTMLWLLGTLCCVRCWCGCRVPTAPPAPPCCAETRCGILWNVLVAGTTRSAWVSVAGAETSGRRGGGRTRAASLPNPLQYLGSNSAQRADENWQGSQHSEPHRSTASSTAMSGVFCETGDVAENWPDALLSQQQQQQQQRSRLSPWPMRGAASSSAASPHSRDYVPAVVSGVATTTAAGGSAHGTNPLMSSSPTSIAVCADGAVTTPLFRSNVPHSSSGGVGAALQSMRSRNVSARGFVPHYTSSPMATTPTFGFPNSGRSGDSSSGGGEAAV